MTDHPSRRAALRQAFPGDLDGLLITDLVNIRYLTGFTGSNAALLIGRTEEGSTFCTDGRYDTQSAAQVPDLPRLIDRPCDLALAGRAAGRIGFEAEHVTVAAHQALVATAGAELVPTAGTVERLRMVKDAGEIQALRRACSIADQALQELFAAGAVRVGRTEKEIGLDLDHRIRQLGADDISFETIVAAGANSAIPHHRPSATTVGAGDFVKFDFGATVAGYHSDMTRTVVVGRAADWQRELYLLVATAQAAGRQALVAGAAPVAVDAAARAVIAEAGHAEHFGHGLGHGVGLQIHEAPMLSPLAAPEVGMISADMCVTVEPGVYLPGRGGVRIEDSGVVRGPAAQRPGYEVLTLFTKDLLEL